MSNTKNRHTLADHAFGALADHVHGDDEGFDHVHDDDPRHELLDSASRDLESTPFLSVGVDIGSATTQVAFSRLTMRGPGEPASIRRLVRTTETLWTSPVVFTPWRGDALDADRIRDIVDSAFDESGLHPDSVDTGAVVLTGDAATSPNAGRLVETLAEDIGDLVGAVAGHHMEAMLAAWGSGAMRRSLETGETILLVDIGGGTTKLAMIAQGRVTEVAALRIGARLLAFETDGRITRSAPMPSEFARRVGLSRTAGVLMEPDDVERIGADLAEMLYVALTQPNSRDVADIWLTRPFRSATEASQIMFSGGVAEIYYGREPRDFGDLGAALGRNLRRVFADATSPWRNVSPGEGIRATVLGASEHSLQISGETNFISSPARLLPKRGLPVVAPIFSFVGEIEPDVLSNAILEKRRMLDLDGATGDFVLALRWRGDPEHARLEACARGIIAALKDRIDAGKALFLLMEGDCALNLAAVLRDEFGLPVDLLVLDGVVLRDFDWVDIGRLRLPSNTVPVTVRSLVFGNQRKPN